MENWKELWNKNYQCEGDCSELASFVKQVGFGKKTNANYLPWAVAERLFEQQDGTLEIIYTDKNQLVESVNIPYKQEVSGDVYNVYSNFVFFVNVRATWKGREYVEKYPIQDSAGNPILTGFTQNDINRAIQRAKVKAIAVISGIGYKLYETGDLQFAETTESEEPVVAKPTKPAVAKPKAKEKPEPEKPVVSETVTEVKQESKVETKVVETPISKPEPVKVEETETVTNEEPKPKFAFSRKDYEEQIKNDFLSGEVNKVTLIRDFTKAHTPNNSLKVSALSDDDIKELVSQLKNL